MIEIPAEIVAHERARAMAAMHTWLVRDREGYDSVVGSDEEAALLLPVVIMELGTALEALTSPQQLRREGSQWLDEHRRRLSEAA